MDNSLRVAYLNDDWIGRDNE